MGILILRTIEELRRAREGWRRVGFVPTMGALHEGHLSLVEIAKKHADTVVASIFVNPLQFGANEDFSRYPRTEDADIALLEKAGAAAVFLPSAEIMYPKGFSTAVEVAGVSEGLCGTSRPGHFRGVATVVARLFGLVRPEVAIFGEKDYQQLQVIRRMVSDLALPVEIYGAPILREPDGLAMSSRNRYLSAAERRTAAQLYAVLKETAEAIRAAGGKTADALTWGKATLLQLGVDAVDYLEACDAETLRPLSQLHAPARLLVAAWLGKTRLIDNLAL